MYRTSSDEEIDLALERGQKKLAFEFKASMSPKVSRGFKGTLEVLRLTIPFAAGCYCFRYFFNYPRNLIVV